MALSLSVADIWKFFGERNQREKQQISDWLFAVAAEAETLALEWGQMATALQNGTAYHENGFFGGIPSFNLMPFGMLSDFYRTASTVLGGRTETGFHGQIAFILGSLLKQRQSALEHYSLLARNFKLAYSMDSDNQDVNMSNLHEAVKALYREAAALKVLAENFKATG